MTGAMLPRRPRIKGFAYTGLHRYSLTICTKDRQPFFRERDVVAMVLLTLQQSAAAHDFALVAYCFMPDHAHAVVSAATETADLRRFVSKWKQRSGYAYRQKTGAFLWQPSYFDHVLRDDEETWRAARYVLENPVRKGLVQVFDEYPYSGSDVFTREQLREIWQRGQGSSPALPNYRTAGLKPCATEQQG